jgi:DNA-binding Lrp family transcriptional regulator
MKGKISDIERKILAVLQEGLPNTDSPYRDMARRLGIETKELLAVLQQWKQQGKLRRIGAIVNHFKVGLGTGAMVVWRAEPQKIAEAGKILAGFEKTSHVYERQISENWPYNLYTMVHAPNSKELQQTVEKMSRASGIVEYRILETEKELKKTPPRYVTEGET